MSISAADHRSSSCKDAIRQFLTQGGRVPVSFGPYIVFPGFCDVHVHFREPGFSYKETIATGTLSAARGGYTAVCTMPNLDPVPDSPENLRVQLELIDRKRMPHILGSDADVIVTRAVNKKCFGGRAVAEL